MGVAYNNFARGGNKPHVTVSDQMGRVRATGEFGSGLRSVIQLAQERPSWKSLLPADYALQHPVPRSHSARMREYSFTNDKRLPGDGTNFPVFCTDSGATPVIWKRAIPRSAAILDSFKSLPEQTFGPSFDGPRRGHGAAETFGGIEGLARRCSPMALRRCHAIAAAMLSPLSGQLGGHRTRVHLPRTRHLLDSIRSVAESVASRGCVVHPQPCFFSTPCLMRRCRRSVLLPRSLRAAQAN